MTMHRSPEILWCSVRSAPRLVFFRDASCCAPHFGWMLHPTKQRCQHTVTLVSGADLRKSQAKLDNTVGRSDSISESMKCGAAKAVMCELSHNLRQCATKKNSASTPRKCATAMSDTGHSEPESEHAKRNRREMEDTLARLRAREAERQQGGKDPDHTDPGPMR